ncbi:MAG: glycosyltransferase family 2 protein [Gammaproteobacteria bacterium]|nr:glycosyltransferase family 2 protein [Gammaproteobacteria bacterium]HRX70257.1 glycosyltransferase family 2 protein [Candidatus Competibacteraceae bacterium]
MTGRIALIVINYRRIADTVECLDSLLRVTAPAFDIFLIDNGSSAGDVAQLTDYVARHPERIAFTAYPENHGFTGAHNRLFEELIPSGRYEYFLLLNNDAVVEPDFLEQMLARIDCSQRIEMVAARVMKYADREQIDNLGITFYKCGLASNRKSLDDPLLGPSGNCALYTAELLRQVHQVSGEYFDDEFFCYAEDTDLAWRAVLLGYRAAYAEEARVYHKGSISSGGPNSDFVLYHGIRNSLFVLVKDAPVRVLLLKLPWMLVLHVAILLRYTIKGKLGVVFRLYRDFLRGIPAMRCKRRSIQQHREISFREIERRISPLFYERGYALGALRDLY